jgi:predicted ATPase
MISSLHLENFKCFRALRLTLGPLTLFTGYNGGGKSSFIQPLLLLSQGLNGRSERGLPLNGPLARLGTVADVAGAGSPLLRSRRVLTVSSGSFPPERESVF